MFTIEGKALDLGPFTRNSTRRIYRRARQLDRLAPSIAKRYVLGRLVMIGAIG